MKNELTNCILLIMINAIYLIIGYEKEEYAYYPIREGSSPAERLPGRDMQKVAFEPVF